jgi:hypothetical protein
MDVRRSTLDLWLSSIAMVLLLPACTLSIEINPAANETPPPVASPTPTTSQAPKDTRTPWQLNDGGPNSPRIILQRLTIEYLGQDGHRLIGSGCPGTDFKGSLEDYHFIVHGVDPGLPVTRILVTGDHSTLTWEWPCHGDWALLGRDTGGGNWDIFIAPSLASKIYAFIFFYKDDSMAMGMLKTA